MVARKFDWNSRYLLHDRWAFSRLSHVLVIPTIDSFLPLLSQTDFPSLILEKSEIYKGVFLEFISYQAKVMSEYKNWNENEWVPSFDDAIDICNSEFSGDLTKVKTVRNQFTRERDFMVFYAELKVWKFFLGLISSQVDKKAAIALERWIYRHYDDISERYNKAMNLWWHVFMDSKVIPDFLVPFRIEIYDLINYSEFSVFHDLARELNDQYYEEADRTGVSIDTVPVATDNLISVFVNNRVNKVLRFLAAQLNLEQKAAVITWAQEECRSSLFLHDPNDLCGEELITHRLPFSDFPTITIVDDLKGNIQFDAEARVHMLPLTSLNR
jgi:hypothetical protein